MISQKLLYLYCKNSNIMTKNTRKDLIKTEKKYCMITEVYIVSRPEYPDHDCAVLIGGKMVFGLVLLFVRICRIVVRPVLRGSGISK